MNYFLQASELPYELPDFEAVHKALEDGTIIPAFQTAIDDHAAEIAAIADSPDDPTWENTFEALEESGEMLDRVLAIVLTSLVHWPPRISRRSKQKSRQCWQPTPVTCC